VNRDSASPGVHPSFVDVFACAVGLILFLLILLAIESAAGADREMEREIELQALTRRDRARDWRRLAAREATLADRLDDARSALRFERIWLRPILELRDRRVAILTELRDAERRAAEAEERLLAAFEATPAMERRPAARPTEKTAPLFLVFAGGRVRPILSTPKGIGVESAHYRFEIMDNDDLLCRPIGPGLAPAEALSDGESGPRLLKDLAPDKNYLACVVYPDSFEAFLQVREGLYARGWEVGFIFRRLEEPMICSYASPANHPH
jgi:hypothetical protein